MPAGSNANNNNNLFLFEVVMITTDPDSGSQTVQTVGIHPLVIVPEMIRYTDTGRSTTTQTLGTLQTKAPRALRRCSMQGSWGVDSAGLLFYVGTGEVRHERFYNEVVRLPDAMSKADVKAATNILTGTPLLPLILAPYDELNSVFAVNFYDFWHGFEFGAQIDSYSWERGHRRGGASGLIHYTLQFTEAGPIIDGSPLTSVLKGVLKAASVWDDANEVIKSYTADALVGSVLNLGDIAIGQLEATIAAVGAQVDGVRALMSAGTAPATSSAAMGDFFQGVADLVTEGEDLIASAGRSGTGAPSADTGAVEMSQVEGEGDNDELLRVDAIEGLEDLVDSARMQEVAGAFFGMGQVEYLAFLMSEADRSTVLRRPDVSRTRPYIVADGDTAASISRRHGVAWPRILAMSRLLPEEALRSGTVLVVPSPRHHGAIPGADLAVYGDQSGEGAWGVDLEPGFPDNTAGELLLVSGEAALIQALETLIEQYSGKLLKQLQQVPENSRAQWITSKLERAIVQDRRFTAVDQVSVVFEGSALALSVVVTAINGETIRVGEAA